jgi:hypothetical protein
VAQLYGEFKQFFPENAVGSILILKKTWVSTKNWINCGCRPLPSYSAAAGIL